MAATSVAALELDCSDSSSMVPSVSEGLYWDNELSAGSQYHPYIKLASNMRDWKPSEVGNYYLGDQGNSLLVSSCRLILYYSS